MVEIVGGLMVRNDRPSFSTFFPLHLERLMPLIDHLYVRIDRSGDPVESFLEPYRDKVTIDYQLDHPQDNHLEDQERQAILDWGLGTGAKWMACFDSDEVLEEGAARVLREFLEEEPMYRALAFPLNYCSHHRCNEGYILDRDEPDNGHGVAAGRMFQLYAPEMRDFRYKGDADGLHCGTLPITRTRHIAVLRELYTVHHHACTPEEWAHKRNFYAGTTEVKRFWENGEWGAYPDCGEPPYSCDRFGKESNAKPYAEVVTDAEHRFGLLMKRLNRPGVRKERVRA